MIMKMSKLKLSIIIASAALVVILAGAFTAISIASYKPTLAFYNVSEKVQKSILDEIATMRNGKKGNAVAYNVVVLEGDRPLSTQKAAKKAKMIFANLDYDVIDYSNSQKIVPMKASLLEGTPTTTKNTAIYKDDKLQIVPLLYDFYQIDVNRPVFTASSVKNINTWNDLVNFFRETSNDDFQAFAFSGGESGEFLDFFGCLVEATCGAQALKDAEQKLYSLYKNGNQDDLMKGLDEMLLNEKAFAPAVKLLKQLYEEKLIHNSALSFKDADTLFFMGNELCNTGFLPLSLHRQITGKIINSYTSIYVPGLLAGAERTFSAPTIAVLSQSKDEYIRSTITLLATSHQTKLSTRSGLAPIQASCSVPDKQADDVRFWLAASNGPVLPLSAALPSKEIKKLVAERITGTVRYGL